VILASMSSKLQKQHENMNIYTMIMYLKEIFDKVSRTKRYETTKELFHCKMTGSSSVNTHVSKMIGYIEKLDQFSFFMDDELNANLVLQSLPLKFFMVYYELSHKQVLSHYKLSNKKWKMVSNLEDPFTKSLSIQKH